MVMLLLIFCYCILEGRKDFCNVTIQRRHDSTHSWWKNGEVKEYANISLIEWEGT
jgi:hypothetical protein